VNKPTIVNPADVTFEERNIYTAAGMNTAPTVNVHVDAGVGSFQPSPVQATVAPSTRAEVATANLINVDYLLVSSFTD